MNAVLSPDIRIRAMHLSDLPSVFEIECAAYPFPWTLQIFQDCLQIGYCARILELEGRIIGYGLMTMAAGEAHVLNLCVHPDWQNCGYGRRILKRLIQLAKKKSIDTLFLEVRPSNQAAIHLYHQVGFNEIGIRKNYYPTDSQNREDALILALPLL